MDSPATNIDRAGGASKEHEVSSTATDIDTLVKRWMESLTPKERELQLLAAQLLETSYFPEKTHGFRTWFAEQAAV